jgi:hypothetical protein
MQHVAKETPKAPVRQVRFPGICTDAVTLGVHRNHLEFDTASRLGVLNGITREHEAGKRTGCLCGEITKNHKRADSDKTPENTGENYKSAALPLS